jgi:peptidyl-prolyl cis-trans isomerase C
VRRSVLAVVLLASFGCQRTPAQSLATGSTPGQSGSTAAQPANQPAGQPAAPAAGQPSQPAAPGQTPAVPGTLDPQASAPPVKPVPATLPEVLARVGGDAIGKAEFESTVRKIEARAKKPVPIEQRDRIYRQILDQMIDVRLIQQEAKARNIVVSDAEIDTEIGKLRQQFKTEDEFSKALASQQMTLDELKTERRREMLVNKTLEAEIVPKVVIQQSDLETFYKEHPENFQQPEQLRASHILIQVGANATDLQKKEARAVADGLLKRVRAGEDFGTLARQYSKDSGSAVNGGDLNYFTKDKMVPPFSAAAAALKPGDVSDVVETQFGYHIIKLTDKKPARQVPLAEVTDQVSNFLRQQKSREMAGQFVLSLRGKYKVEILI